MKINEIPRSSQWVSSLPVPMLRIAKESMGEVAGAADGVASRHPSGSKKETMELPQPPKLPGGPVHEFR